MIFELSLDSIGMSRFVAGQISSMSNDKLRDLGWLNLDDAEASGPDGEDLARGQARNARRTSEVNVAFIRRMVSSGVSSS
jgi:hypothetical protein